MSRTDCIKREGRWLRHTLSNSLEVMKSVAVPVRGAGCVFARRTGPSFRRCCRPREGRGLRRYYSVGTVFTKVCKLPSP